MTPRVELVDTALLAFKPAPERFNPLLEVRKVHDFIVVCLKNSPASLGW